MKPALNKLATGIRRLLHLRHAHPSGWDALVIGAGLGGLATAILLAKKGHRVLVLEKNQVIGGYASQVSYDGIAFDLGAQDITILGKEGMRIVRHLGLNESLRPMRPHAVSIYPDHRFVWDSGSAEGTKSYLLAGFPAQAGALQCFFDEMEAIYEEMDRYLTPRNLRPDMRAFPRLARYHNYTAEQLLKEFFFDTTLMSLLSSYCLFYQGMPVHSLSALHFVGLLQSYFDTGAFYAYGGIGALSEKMRSRLEELGGRVESGACVNGVMVDGGRACGVSLADGRKLCGGAVVANIDPRILYSKFLPRSDVTEPVTFELKANHLSRCQLFVLMDDDAPELPFVTFYATTYDKAEEYQAFVCGDPLSMRIFCPPGSPRTLSIAVPAPYELWQSARTSGSATYEAMKQVLTERLLGLLRNAYPELVGKIRALGMVTPVDLEDWSGNCGGSLYGADAIPGQSGLHGAAIASQLPGLFLTGQWSAGGSATLVLRGAALVTATVNLYLRRGY